MDDRLNQEIISINEHTNWKNSHSCPAKYSNLSINEVESALAVSLLEQASNRGVNIAGLVCDGDNDTFDMLRRKATFKEYECLKHIQGQLFKKLYKCDSKQLTWDVCGKITKLYYKAVVDNLGDVDSIIQNINAIPDEIKKSAKWLSQDSIQQISDVISKYRYNCSELIERVRFGYTTNNNESLHRLISRSAPKTGPVGNHAYRLSAALGVIQYNDGFHGITSIFKQLGIEPGRHMIQLFNDSDSRRVSQSVRLFEQKEKLGVEEMKPMKQMKKYTKGYSSGKYTVTKPDSSSEETDAYDTQNSDFDE